MTNSESRQIQITSASSPYGQLVRVRRGSSYARGRDIDVYLSEGDTEVLYKRWRKSWAEPIGLRGGIESITCEMILEIPRTDLVKVYGVMRATRLIKAAKQGE